MADIELVIKIPENVYKHIQSLDWKNIGRWSSDELKAIHNGTPLPKGHGRLIDEKDLSLMTVHMIDGMLVCDAPTIIEADGGDVE